MHDASRGGVARALKLSLESEVGVVAVIAPRDVEAGGDYCDILQTPSRFYSMRATETTG